MILISPLLISYLVVFLVGVGLEILLTGLNVRHLRKHGHRVPEPFEEFIDEDKLFKITDYTIENQRFGTFTSCIENALFLCIILFGVLPWLVQHIEGLELGVIASGIIFFAILSVSQGLFSLPFDYYKTFVIEQRYGFNTSTLRIWVTSLIQ